MKYPEDEKQAGFFSKKTTSVEEIQEIEFEIQCMNIARGRSELSSFDD